MEGWSDVCMLVCLNTLVHTFIFKGMTWTVGAWAWAWAWAWVCVCACDCIIHFTTGAVDTKTLKKYTRADGIKVINFVSVGVFVSASLSVSVSVCACLCVLCEHSNSFRIIIPHAK